MYQANIKLVSQDEDGIHSDNEDDVLLGNVYLVNTTITVNAGDDELMLRIR